MSHEPARKRDSIHRPVAITVEGADYFYFLLSQVDGRKEFDGVQLFDFSQVTLAKWLELFVAQSGFETVRAIGIIRDAEDNARNMAASVRDSLRKNGLPAPESPLEIQKSESLAVGYMIVPHGNDSGCLEDACLDAVSSEARQKCVEDYLQCVDRPHRNDRWRAKVKVHSLIAGSAKPQLTLGESAKAGLWDFEHPSLSVMIDFIQKVRDA